MYFSSMLHFCEYNKFQENNILIKLREVESIDKKKCISILSYMSIYNVVVE